MLQTIDVLEERLDKLESGAGLKAPADEDEVQDLVEKEQRLARELLDSEKENIELRFQLEAAREDARRLEAELAETAAPAASDRSVEELERVVEAMGRATKKLQVGWGGGGERGFLVMVSSMGVQGGKCPAQGGGCQGAKQPAIHGSPEREQAAQAPA